MKPANNAPIYCGLYVDLAEIARKHGYAMALHGSMARDFDLICIPWIEVPSSPQVVVDEICNTFAIRETGKQDITYHGRMRHTVVLSYNECFLDLQFMPATQYAEVGNA